jgi:hypothetical protein
VSVGSSAGNGSWGLAFRAGGGHGRPPAFPISRTWGRHILSREKMLEGRLARSTRLVENSEPPSAPEHVRQLGRPHPRLSAQMPPPGRCLSASTVSARSSSTHTSARHHLRLVEQGAESAVVRGHRQGRPGSDGSMLSVVVTDDDRATAGATTAPNARPALPRCRLLRLPGPPCDVYISAPHSAEFACGGGRRLRLTSPWTR